MTGVHLFQRNTCQCRLHEFLNFSSAVYQVRTLRTLDDDTKQIAHRCDLTTHASAVHTTHVETIGSKLLLR